MKITDRSIESVQPKGRRWRFAELQRGQCLEFSAETDQDLSAFRSAAHHAKKRYGFEITVRCIEGNLYGAFRLA